MAQPERERIGDRLERAIDQHADLERELEQADAEPVARTSLRRTLIWLTITAVSLYLVAPALFDVLGSYEDVTEAGARLARQ